MDIYQNQISPPKDLVDRNNWVLASDFVQSRFFLYNIFLRAVFLNTIAFKSVAILKIFLLIQ